MGSSRDIGRALPAISENWRTILQQGQNAQDNEFKRQQLGLQVEQNKREQAMSEITMNKLKMEQEREAKREKFRQTPIPVSALKNHPFYEELYAPAKDMGLVTKNDATGQEFITGEHLEYLATYFSQNPEKTQDVLDKKLGRLVKEEMNITQQLQGGGEGTTAKKLKPEEQQALQQRLGQINQQKSQIQSNIMALNKAMKPDTTMSEAEILALPEGDSRRTSLIGGKRAIQPETQEKNANIQYQTDAKGNVWKIVSDPITGKTASKENMGPIGKGGIDEEKEARAIGKDAATLRKEFNNLKEVKDYKDVRSKISIMDSALKESEKTKNFVGVDQALITLFNKMTDPQSVVRESEYVRTPNDMSMYNQLLGKLEKLRSGGAGLTSDERKALVKMGHNFMKVYDDIYRESAKEYRGYAKTSKIDPDLVVKEKESFTALGNIAANKPQLQVGPEGKKVVISIIEELKSQGTPPGKIIELMSEEGIDPDEFMNYIEGK
jgi:hypothetical protein